MDWDAWIAWLSRWQELAGAALGGFLGLAAALLVARDGRMRAQRIAAAQMTADLVMVKIVCDALEERMDDLHVPPEGRPLHAVELLISRGRPKLSQLFEGHLASIQLTNAPLSAHATMFAKIYRDFEWRMERLTTLSEQAIHTRLPVRFPQEFKANAKLTYDGFLLAAKHADCAMRLLEYYILGKLAWWHRLKEKLGAPPPDKECAQLRKRGE